MRLSTEAKVVGALFFSRMTLTELTFQRPHIIHPKMRKGLDELVAAGLLTVEKLNDISDTLMWRPTEALKTKPPKVSDAFIEKHSFPVTIDESATRTTGDAR